MKRALSSLAHQCTNNDSYYSRCSKRQRPRRLQVLMDRSLSRFMSSNVKKELSQAEQKENIRWAVGFFGVIIFANVFTVWQEWDALTASKRAKVSNGLDEIDLESDDTKTKLPKFSY